MFFMIHNDFDSLARCPKHLIMAGYFGVEGPDWKSGKFANCASKIGILPNFRMSEI